MATSELCRLFSLGNAMSPTEEERFRLLTDAVEAYERTHHPIPDPSPAALLGHLLEAKESTPARLAKETGIARRDIAAILKGKRDIGASEAAALARYFRVEESVFAGVVSTVRMHIDVVSAGAAELRAHSPGLDRPFVPRVLHNRVGDFLELYWENVRAYCDPLDKAACFDLLRAVEDKRVVGVKVYGVSKFSAEQ